MVRGRSPSAAPCSALSMCRSHNTNARGGSSCCANAPSMPALVALMMLRRTVQICWARKGHILMPRKVVCVALAVASSSRLLVLLRTRKVGRQICSSNSAPACRWSAICMPMVPAPQAALKRSVELGSMGMRCCRGSFTAAAAPPSRLIRLQRAGTGHFLLQPVQMQPGTLKGVCVARPSEAAAMAGAPEQLLPLGRAWRLPSLADRLCQAFPPLHLEVHTLRSRQ